MLGFLLCQNCIAVLVLGVPPDKFRTKIRRVKPSQDWPTAVEQLRSPQRRGLPVHMHRKG